MLTQDTCFNYSKAINKIFTEVKIHLGFRWRISEYESECQIFVIYVRALVQFLFKKREFTFVRHEANYKHVFL